MLFNSLFLATLTNHVVIKGIGIYNHKQRCIHWLHFYVQLFYSLDFQFNPNPIPIQFNPTQFQSPIHGNTNCIQFRIHSINLFIAYIFHGKIRFGHTTC